MKKEEWTEKIFTGPQYLGGAIMTAVLGMAFLVTSSKLGWFGEFKWWQVVALVFIAIVCFFFSIFARRKSAASKNNTEQGG